MGNQQGVERTEADAKTMERAEYFHGFLSMDYIETMLVCQGDFLVREALRLDQMEIVISVRWNGTCRHFIIQMDNKGYFCLERNLAFPTCQELVAYYWENNRRLSEKSAVVLMKPVGVQPWEIFEEELVEGEDSGQRLGKGAFGLVLSGCLKKGKEKGVRKVAVKYCDERTAKEKKEEFLNEAKMNLLANHEYVVELIGICTFSPQLKIVMQKVNHGSLESFIKQNRKNITPLQLLKCCLDCAKGLAHLESLKILHMDIAARNCLMHDEASCQKPEPGELYRALIADFGLSRKGPQLKIPMDYAISQRWAAPELLGREPVATIKSDCWSFGVLLWEIYSGAKTPYPEVKTDSAILMFLQDSKRMAAPASAPQRVQTLMKKCWEFNPVDRPTFAESKRVIERCYASRKEAK